MTTLPAATETKETKQKAADPEVKMQKDLAADAEKGMSIEDMAEKHGLLSKTVLSYLRHEALRRCRQGTKVGEVRKALGLSFKDFVYTPNRGKSWSDEDVKYLEDNKDKSIQELVDHLGRTVGAIESKLGIGKDYTDRKRERVGQRRFRLTDQEASDRKTHSLSFKKAPAKKKMAINLEDLDKEDLIKLLQKALSK